MAGSLRVDLLGPLEVSGDDGPVALQGAKRRALVAILALAAPHPVSADRLIDELWGDGPPGNPTNALQAQVSQVRHLLGRDALTHDDTGYVLAIDPAAVDALELERLVGEGRQAVADGEPRTSEASFGQAVALLRGPPLADLVDHAFARDAALRLEALGLDAHEGLLEAELASGRHAEVVPRLTDLVRLHPLRERFHALLLLALYRCGRQAEALRAYQAARETLLDELGVDPGPELQALEQAILAQDPALASPVAIAPAIVTALPTALSSFIGREQEVAALLDLVAEHRLVTVVAVGGMGKTRVALEVAHRLALDQEVRFVELAPVTEPVAVPETIAEALGAADQGAADNVDNRSPVDRIVDRLRERDLVVVLDNAEHLVEAVATVVTALLRGCPGLRVLVTSRQTLGLAGEQQFDLGPLVDADAAQLFADRAQAVQPRFSSEGAGTEVADLCRRLDRLPLAIELAAARTKTLGLTEIAERLDDRFDLLRAGGRVGEGGHDGLRAAIDWSYESLFEDERRVFARLAVFAGGATSAAVQEVFGGDALDLVERLVDKSLVVADTSGERVRFRMLESLRAYGLDRLAEGGDLEAAQAAHLAWCTELAATAEPHMRRAEQLEWLERTDAEHDNLRAALAHAAAADPVGGLHLIGSLIFPWYFRGRLQEARHWAELCLAGAPDAPVIVRAKVLAWIGLLADVSTWTDEPGGIEAELDLAETRIREAIDLLDDTGDEYRLAEAHRMLVLNLARQASTGTAVDTEAFAVLLSATIERYVALDEPYGLSFLNSVRGIMALVQGDLDEARRAAEFAVAYGEQSGERFSLSRAVWLSGLVDEAAGDPVAAYGHIERGLRLLAELRMEQHVTAQASLLARLADVNGEPALAEQWRTFVAERGGEGVAGDDMATAAMAQNLEGLAARAEGKLDKAQACHEEAQRWYADSGVAGGVAFTESCLGFLAGARGDVGGAHGHHLAALAAAVEADEPGALALAFEGLASVMTTEPSDATAAATLLGGGAAHWARAPGHRDPVHDADVAAAADRIRAVLDEPNHARSWAEGEAMATVELVVLARQARPAA